MSDKPEEKSTMPLAASKGLGTGVAMRAAGAGAMFVPGMLSEIVEFAQLMCRAGPAVPPALRGNPGVCAAVTMQAMRWQMDPFSVAQKAYVTTSKGGDQRLAYEAQLVAAVINTRSPLVERPRLKFEGEGGELRCTVSGMITGETQEREIRTPKVKDIVVKNSPLWTSDPEQQLAYYALRAFARRWFPEILLGVYTPDELADLEPVGSSTTAEPKPAQFRGGRGTPGDGLEVVDDEVDREAASDAAQRAADRLQRAAERGPEPEEPAGDAQSEAQAGAAAEPGPAATDGAEPAGGQETGAGEAEIDAAIKAEEQAIADGQATVDRLIEGIGECADKAAVADLAERAREIIASLPGVPAKERGAMRGRFNQVVLERERALAKPPSRKRP